MSDYPVTREARPGDPHLRLRLAAFTAVVVGVVLVALAAFLLSYTGIHEIALQAGVAPGLARLYPLMFDAMLIVTCSAVLATRTAGWGTKTYVWICLLLVVGAVAVGDALHATGVHLTGQAARATIAVVPWVLLLLGFGIWLVMLRHWRRIRMADAVNGAEAGRPAQADLNGHNGRAMPAAPAAPTPQVGTDAPLEQQAGRAPERPRAADDTAASQATATGQGKQGTIAPGEHQPAGATAATTAGTAAAAGTAAGIAAGMAAGTKPGTPGETKPGTAEEAKPGTTAENRPGTTAENRPGTAATISGTAVTASKAAATAPGTTATAPGSVAATPGTTPGSGETTSGTADVGAGAHAMAGPTGSADQASTGQDNGGKDMAGTLNHRRRLGGLLEMPLSEDDEEGSVRILPEPPKAAATDAASGQDGGEAGGTGDGTETPASTRTEGGKAFESLPAAAADPDPANPPAPLPHFDRPRSTPTPPRETGADGE